ncbi:uncharacterized protein PFB0315w [Glossina fuscipes]|uniref:Uncharacterized protein PFB0315w n=2 Tax=Nemorhina TaxID=44051 RepID=A0A8U0W929_9MUSC|nr:uncharacterized protein PFB0315w [Glossina fuscipes]KAI9587863.1 hypothetical protein GQX74_003709 [Glossina fuscipes]
MEESELTRKAINEILKDMNVCKKNEISVTERKVKPNKRFLGRTLNSMITHNKRESDRTQRQCQRKLLELEAKRRKILCGESYRSKTRDAHEVLSNSCDEKRQQRKKKHKKKRKKRRKRYSSSASTSDSEAKEEKFLKQKYQSVNDRSEYYNGEIKGEQNIDGYYVSPNFTYATLAFNHHMNRLWIHQQLVNEQLLAKKKLVDNSAPNLLIDITLSSSSDTSLNVSINSSSAEEDENGIITFYLSSDEESFSEKLKDIAKMKNENKQTYLSLNSKTSVQATETRINSDVMVLSSSSSSSSGSENEGEIRKTGEAPENPKYIQNNFNALIVDLTQE